MTRNIFALLCTLSLGAGAAIAGLLLTAAAPMEQFTGGPGWDVPGNDYSRLEANAGPLGAPTVDCYRTCLNDGRCRASVLYHDRPNHFFCYLKYAVSKPVLKSGVESYVKLIQPGRMLYNNNLPGWDYSHFQYDGTDPTPCMNACRNDGHCASWSFVYPNNNQGPRANCWLKSGVPNFVTNNCCVSGWMR